MSPVVTSDELKRKLRSLKRLERGVRGSDGSTPVFDRFFSESPGDRVQYPFSILLAFDHHSRKLAIAEYMTALYLGGVTGPGAELVLSAELFTLLEIPPWSDEATVVAAFRRVAKHLHPDTGGDEIAMRALLDLYHRWRAQSGAYSG